MQICYVKIMNVNFRMINQFLANAQRSMEWRELTEATEKTADLIEF